MMKKRELTRRELGGAFVSRREEESVASVLKTGEVSRTLSTEVAGLTGGVEDR